MCRKIVFHAIIKHNLKHFYHILIINGLLHNTINISDATIYVGGLDEKVSDTLMWELFVQAGPVGKINISNTSLILI
jgi:RNA recognition motif-containing protein